MAMESQEMEKIKKKIGLYILNFNGIKWLKICLPNVVKFCSICEIFIIDNNSKDGSVEFVKEKFPAIIIKKINLIMAFPEDIINGCYQNQNINM